MSVPSFEEDLRPEPIRSKSSQTAGNCDSSHRRIAVSGGRYASVALTSVDGVALPDAPVSLPDRGGASGRDPQHLGRRKGPRLLDRSDGQGHCGLRSVVRALPVAVRPIRDVGFDPASRLSNLAEPWLERVDGLGQRPESLRIIPMNDRATGSATPPRPSTRTAAEIVMARRLSALRPDTGAGPAVASSNSKPCRGPRAGRN
jgi:hypothetical protein